MLTEEGMNGTGETHWSLLVPEEHVQPGLEIGIRATEGGLQIGDGMIDWGALERARKEAQRNLPF